MRTVKNPLYWAAGDVSDCFTSLDHSILEATLRKLLGEPYVIVFAPFDECFADVLLQGIYLPQLLGENEDRREDILAANLQRGS